jgi:VWFA-related protein
MPHRSLPWTTAVLLLGAAAVGAQAPPLEKIPEFAVGTQVVRIDVVVTDDHDQPVAGLTQDDFAIFEDKHPQEITNFEAYSGGRLSSVPQRPEAVAPGSGGLIEGYQRRFVVFAIDDLHIDVGDLSGAKGAMRRFVHQQLQPQDQVAVVALSGALGLYQDFSDDPALLWRAISRVTPKMPRTDWTGPPQITEYQAELIERGDPTALYIAVQEILQSEPPGTRADPEAAQRRATRRARAIRAESSHLVRVTLETLNSVARGLSDLPGRKVIVLVSDGFPMGLGTANSQVFDVRRITDAATRAGVVIYSLDARGLVATPAGANASDRGAPSLAAPGAREAIARDGQESVREGMNGLAEDTGGFLVYNMNDAGAGLDRILRDTETYYLLAYQPTNTRQDGRFRRIEVRLPGRHGLRIRTRKGYFAPDERKADKAPSPAEAGRRAADQLRDALASLYPRSDIPVRLSADFVSLEHAGPQIVVSGHVDLTGVRFKRVENRYQAALDLAGAVYDGKGLPFADLEPQRVSLRLTPADYEQARKEGLKYQKVLPVEPGSYDVRLAVREGGTGRLGSASQRIDVPDTDGGQLTMSGLFLLRAGGRAPAGDTTGAAKEASLRDVQAFPRFERKDSLYYQLQVLNPKKDAAGETHLTAQAYVYEQDHLLASTQEMPVTLSRMGWVPMAYMGRITLGPLPSGKYELQVAVTDHLVKKTILRRVGFDVEP